MLMVLEIGKRRRRGLREYLRSALQPPRRLEVREVVRETGRYGILTAYPDKKGELPWEDVRQAAGKEARHLLCPAGCTLPEEEGLLPFRPSGQMQGQLMQQAALFLLRRASRGKKQRRIAVGVYDPDGVRPDLAVSLLPYAAEVQVNTGCPQRYRSAGRIAMEESRCLPDAGRHGRRMFGDCRCSFCWRRFPVCRKGAADPVRLRYPGETDRRRFLSADTAFLRAMASRASRRGGSGTVLGGAV